MHEFVDLFLLAGGALIGSALAAVTGFGGAAVLLPILVLIYGVRDAIPILTVAQLIGNGGRVWFNRRELAAPVVGWFAVGAVPSALVGGLFFASTPLSLLKRLLGIFLLGTVACRHRARSARRFAALSA